MAQSGYTPIILFNSGTTGHVPTTGNLTLGELAINYTDGKIFYNNGSAIVQYSPPAITLAATSGTINGVVIGGTTPAAATFSTLTVNSTISGSGITSLFASPPPIGSTAPAAGSFTALTSNSLVINPSSPSMTELQIGSGATTNAGLYLGNDISGYGAIWPTVVAPTTTNYALAAGAVTYLNNLSSVVINIANSPVITVSSDTATTKGTVLGGNAAAGVVGEFLSANGGPTGVSAGALLNLGSISLTAGDWDVWGFVAAGGSGTSSILAGLSLTAASSSWIGVGGSCGVSFPLANVQAGFPTARLNISATTTVFFNILMYSGTSQTCSWVIEARRVR